MPENESRLTVYFEPPFWVGVYERVCGGKLEAARIVFGGEPKDYEVYDYLLQNWGRLHFSPAVAAERTESDRSVNPKRRQKIIRAELGDHGGSTKSQQALALQRERDHVARREQSHQTKEVEKARRFALRQEKRKEKRRGH